MGLVAANDLSVTLPRPSEEIACPESADGGPPVVLLALGQSNAANQGDTLGRSPFGALWYEGRCYAIADPLAGATGKGGSIWSRLASMAAADLGRRSLIIIVLAVDGTPLSDWIDPGSISKRLGSLVDTLRTRRLNVSAVLWQQGEADARMGTSNGKYSSEMTVLVHRLREHGISGPMLLAQSTRCRNSGSNDLHAALTQVVQQEPNVFPGPDTDALGEGFRSDGCHFNDAGLNAAAIAWLDVLRQRDVFNAH